LDFLGIIASGVWVEGEYFFDLNPVGFKHVVHFLEQGSFHILTNTDESSANHFQSDTTKLLLKQIRAHFVDFLMLPPPALLSSNPSVETSGIANH